MAKAYGVFHPGGGADRPVGPSTMEFWASEGVAKDSLIARRNDPGVHTVCMAEDATTARVRFGSVSKFARIDLYRVDVVREATGASRIVPEDKPYARLEIGPFGGVRKVPL